MFVRSRSIAVRSFTPSALPDFFAIPVLIPGLCPLSGSLSRSPSILGPFSGPRAPLARLVASTSPCCSMPSATPGRCQPLVSIAADHCCLHPLPRPWPPYWYFGANYRIQRLTLHLRNLSSTPWFFVRFRCRVSVPTLSIMRRVPSYSIARSTRFDEDTGWLTTPFPRGLSPP